MPPWPSLRAFLGSDAKVLSAALPVRLGLDACDAARAGLVGPRDILEHPDGFLAAFASVPLPDAVDLALGRRWHTETLSFKVHPGGPGLDAAVDCAAQLHRVLGPVTIDDVDEVVVTTSMYTLLVDQKAAEFLDRERSPVSALVFCTPYAVATTLLTGGLTAADFGLPSTADEQRWRLAAKIRLEHDAGMTRQSLLSEAPSARRCARQARGRQSGWKRSAHSGSWTWSASCPRRTTRSRPQRRRRPHASRSGCAPPRRTPRSGRSGRRDRSGHPRPSSRHRAGEVPRRGRAGEDRRHRGGPARRLGR